MHTFRSVEVMSFTKESNAIEELSTADDIHINLEVQSSKKEHGVL